MRRPLVFAAVLTTMVVSCKLPLPPSGSPTPFVWPSATPTVPLQTRRPSPTSTSSVPTATPQPTVSPHLGVEYTGGAPGRIWSLAEVRVGSYPEKFRVVFEMIEPGDQVPQFRAVELDNEANPLPAGHDPSWGAARIDVFITDLYAYGYPLEAELPIEVLESPLVTRVGSYPTYDDALLGFSIGLREPAAYEVFELSGPVRIVVDVVY
jgi:hypothetical protein